ncbi:MAG: hypothetical protein ACE5EC_02120 [Phycisphaerae bacterium]
MPERVAAATDKLLDQLRREGRMRILVSRFRSDEAADRLGEAVHEQVIQAIDRRETWGRDAIRVLSSSEPFVDEAMGSITPDTSAALLEEIADRTHATHAIVGKLRPSEDAYHFELSALHLREGRMKATVSGSFPRSRHYDDLYYARVEIPRFDEWIPDVSVELVSAARRSAARLLRSIKMEQIDAGFKIVIGAIRGPDEAVITKYGDRFGDLLLLELQSQSGHRFRPLARKRLLHALEAQRIEYKDLHVFFDEGSRKRLDQSLGADAVVVGDVVRLGRGAQITIEIVDLETKELLAHDVATLAEARDQEDLFRPVASDAGPLEVEFGIFMQVPGGLVKLEQGSRMLSNVGWKMGFQANEPCYAYVWQTDSRGIYQALLPGRLPAVRDATNRITPASPFILPAGPSWLRLDHHTGEETFCLLFSRDQMTDLDRLLRSLPPEGVSRDSAEARQLRGYANPGALTLRGTALRALELEGGDSLEGFFDGGVRKDYRPLDLSLLKAGPADPNVIRHSVSYRHE